MAIAAVMLEDGEISTTYDELRDINPSNRLLSYLVYYDGTVAVNPNLEREFNQRFRDPSLGKKETPLALKLACYYDALQRAISAELISSRINA